jgi:hypothetical protein
MVWGDVHDLTPILPHGLPQLHSVNQATVHHQGLGLTGFGQHAHPLHFMHRLPL